MRKEDDLRNNSDQQTESSGSSNGEEETQQATNQTQDPTKLGTGIQQLDASQLLSAHPLVVGNTERAVEQLCMCNSLTRDLLLRLSGLGLSDDQVVAAKLIMHEIQAYLNLAGHYVGEVSKRMSKFNDTDTTNTTTTQLTLITAESWCHRAVRALDKVNALLEKAAMFFTEAAQSHDSKTATQLAMDKLRFSNLTRAVLRGFGVTSGTIEHAADTLTSAQGAVVAAMLEISASIDICRASVNSTNLGIIAHTQPGSRACEPTEVNIRKWYVNMLEAEAVSACSSAEMATHSIEEILSSAKKRESTYSASSTTPPTHPELISNLSAAVSLLNNLIERTITNTPYTFRPLTEHVKRYNYNQARKMYGIYQTSTESALSQLVPHIKEKLRSALLILKEDENGTADIENSRARHAVQIAMKLTNNANKILCKDIPKMVMFALTLLEAEAIKATQDVTDKDSSMEKAITVAEPVQIDEEEYFSADESSKDKTTTPVAKPVQTDAEQCLPEDESSEDKATTPVAEPVQTDAEKCLPEDKSSEDKTTTPVTEPVHTVKEATTPVAEPVQTDAEEFFSEDESSEDKATTPVAEPVQTDAEEFFSEDESSEDKATTPVAKPVQTDAEEFFSEDESSEDKATTPVAEPVQTDAEEFFSEDESSEDKATTPVAKPVQTDAEEFFSEDESSEDKATTPVAEPVQTDAEKCLPEDKSSEDKTTTPVTEPVHTVKEATTPVAEPVQTDAEEFFSEDESSEDKATTPVAKPVQTDAEEFFSEDESSEDKATTPVAEPVHTVKEATTPVTEPVHTVKEASTPVAEPVQTDAEEFFSEDESSEDKATTPVAKPVQTDAEEFFSEDESSEDKATTPAIKPVHTVKEATTPVTKPVQTDAEEFFSEDESSEDKATTPVTEPVHTVKEATTPVTKPVQTDAEEFFSEDESSRETAMQPGLCKKIKAALLAFVLAIALVILTLLFAPVLLLVSLCATCFKIGMSLTKTHRHTLNHEKPNTSHTKKQKLSCYGQITNFLSQCVIFLAVVGCMVLLFPIMIVAACVVGVAAAMATGYITARACYNFHIDNHASPAIKTAHELSNELREALISVLRTCTGKTDTDTSISNLEALSYVPLSILCPK